MSAQCPTCHGRGVLPEAKTCALEGCGREFTWQDDGRGRGRPRKDSRYCSRSCRLVANQRAYRKRAAEGTRPAASAKARRPSPEELAARSPVVYYMRLGDVIKIGTTTRLETRIKQLTPDEVMAVEPGGRDLERQRHRQFRHLRVRGEYFEPGEDLIAHVHHTREINGSPFGEPVDDVPF